MKNILDFLRIPFVKIIGICVVLYFALFSNKQNPDSLRNRLSKEQVTKNLQTAKEQSQFIISNVRMAQGADKNTVTAVEIEDTASGQDGEAAACGSEVVISYGIYDSSNKQIKFIDSESLVIGSKKNELIEKNITGLKPDSVRNLRIPKELATNDKNLSEMLKFYGNIRYQISVKAVTPHPESQSSC